MSAGVETTWIRAPRGSWYVKLEQILHRLPTCLNLWGNRTVLKVKNIQDKTCQVEWTPYLSSSCGWKMCLVSLLVCVFTSIGGPLEEFFLLHRASCHYKGYRTGGLIYKRPPFLCQLKDSLFTGFLNTSVTTKWHCAQWSQHYRLCECAWFLLKLLLTFKVAINVTWRGLTQFPFITAAF